MRAMVSRAVVLSTRLPLLDGFCELHGFTHYGLGNGISSEFHGSKALSDLLMQRQSITTTKAVWLSVFQHFTKLKIQPACLAHSSFSATQGFPNL